MAGFRLGAAVSWLSVGFNWSGQAANKVPRKKWEGIIVQKRRFVEAGEDPIQVQGVAHGLDIQVIDGCG
jgi:hypothetical protein